MHLEKGNNITDTFKTVLDVEMVSMIAWKAKSGVQFSVKVRIFIFI